MRPGFSRLRRMEQEKEEEPADGSQPLDTRCTRYMQEFCDILPLLPPQLPETPSQEEVSQEMLLMERVTKLKKQFGREVHQRAMELAKGAVPAETEEVFTLATGLRDRLVARKVLAADCQVVGPAETTAKASPALNTNAQPEEEVRIQQPSSQQGFLGCMAGLARKLCAQ
ncbi:SLC4A10 [Symbiodinium natans]|uniref:SLC4A10 protein n=1 Tax=Symbiodinium natans TaxID=878477 RepID=A0A812Q607_9DINO|nr:SLC4A10 [Symbiodinium natans]